MVGLVDTKYLTAHGRDRGTEVHATIALDIQGDLDEDSVDPEVMPYLKSWRAFAPTVEVIESEVELQHRALGYVGHPDLIVRCEGVPRLIIDMKCGAKAGWHPLQTAAYALADAFITGGPTAARGSLYLSGDGKPAAFVRHDRRSDFEVWKAAVTLAHYLRGNP